MDSGVRQNDEAPIIDMNVFAVLIALAGLALAPLTHAQQYPAKPVRIVVTFGGGGAAEIYSRLIGQHLTEMWGQPVLADPRPGANGIIATEIVARAPADGYTMLAGVDGTHTINPSFYRKLPYDAVKDFAPITQMFLAPLIVSVHPSIPVKNMKELAAFARPRPGEVAFSSAGHGNAGHLAGELFKAMAGIHIVAISYASSSQEIAELVAGQVQLTINSPAAVMGQVKLGKLRALAVTTVEASPLAPGLPTVASTLPGYESDTSYGIFAPAKTPAAIIHRLNQEIVRVLTTAQSKERLFNSGLEVVGSSPEQYATTIKSEIVKWGKVIKDGGIKVE